MEKNKTVIAMTVRIPSYLDRNPIVSHLSATEYELDEFNQWAEPMDANLTRVIAHNLSRLLAADNADVFPAARELPYGYEVGVEVLRLDGKLGDQVTLIPRWGIFGTKDEDVIVLRKFEYQDKIEDDAKKSRSTPPGTAQGYIPENYNGFVMAQSRAVEKLSREIAEAMKKILSN